ncbi:LAETG motif-containing sortase-dependent surface protein [Streptomyces sp. NPDC048389]|uniref:LAETG motif-containing sortase-dependent surface protein n=1 Tax=Streptomyces sp. NPDC048389 TaxID=3154622 RepID=UPI003451C2C3
MSVARRPLLTATAAGTLLCALWFVPSANATAEDPAEERPAGASSGTVTEQAGQERLLLAETGTPDTTPYVIGGSACLAVGAGFVGFSMRRGASGTV